MAASNVFGRGFGERRLKVITDAYPDIMGYNLTDAELKEKILELNGFDEITASQFVEHFTLFKQFYKELSYAADLSNLNVVVVAPPKKESLLLNKKVVFTGFRNTDLEEYVEASGGKVSTSVSKNTDILVYIGTTSAKYLKAVELGIETLSPDEFRAKYVVV